SVAYLMEDCTSSFALLIFSIRTPLSSTFCKVSVNIFFPCSLSSESNPTSCMNTTSLMLLVISSDKISSNFDTISSLLNLSSVSFFESSFVSFSDVDLLLSLLKNLLHQKSHLYNQFDLL